MRTEKETTTASLRKPRVIQQLQPNKTCKCGACEPPRPKLPEGTRRLKVCYKYSSGGTQVPAIMLQGEWLRKAGFEYGDEILVNVTKKQLIVNFGTE